MSIPESFLNELPKEKLVCFGSKDTITEYKLTTIFKDQINPKCLRIKGYARKYKVYDPVKDAYYLNELDDTNYVKIK